MIDLQENLTALKKAAFNLKSKLEMSKKPLASEMLSGELGKLINRVLAGELSRVDDVPYFELIAHGALSEVENEYLDFYSLLVFGRSAIQN